MAKRSCHPRAAVPVVIKQKPVVLPEMAIVSSDNQVLFHFESLNGVAVPPSLVGSYTSRLAAQQRLDLYFSG